MDSVGSIASDTLARRLLKTRLTLVDRVLQGLVVVALVAAPVSVSRSFTTGWMPVYTLHIVVALVILGVYCFRRAIPFPLKSALLIVVFWSIGIAGLLSFGILGAGYWWLVLSSLLVSTLYSVRAGIVTAVATTVLMAAVGLAFIWSSSTRSPDTSKPCSTS